MRTCPNLRKLRPAPALLGALTLTLPTTAYALSASPAGAGAPRSSAPLRLSIDHSRVGYGGRVTVTGRAAETLRGRTLLLQLAPGGGTAWRSVAAAKIHTRGEFRLSTSLERSGALRVLVAAPARPASGALLDPGQTAPVAPTAPRYVSVGSKLIPAPGTFIAGGQIAGTLLPRIVGRAVHLQVGSSRGWHTVATGRTGRDGHFHIARPPVSGPARVSFGGDRFSRAAATGRARLLSFSDDLASWYDDNGATACGFHAALGVANRDLPCGAKVTFRYHGRTVRATVDDRGPYVGGRNWDLNQNTAAALGFDGVATVQVAA